MFDLKQQQQQEQCSVCEDDGVLKRCSDCLTTTTPLWRGGPAGPKTLCNACGIKFHKRRRALLGIQKGKLDKKPNNNNNNNNNNGMPLKIKVMNSGMKRRRENIEEVEQAAMLLMALSYGSLYA